MIWKNGMSWHDSKIWELQKWWKYYHEDIFSRTSSAIAFVLGFGYWLVISKLLLFVLSGGKNV